MQCDAVYVSDSVTFITQDHRSLQICVKGCARGLLKPVIPLPSLISARSRFRKLRNDMTSQGNFYEVIAVMRSLHVEFLGDTVMLKMAGINGVRNFQKN